MVALIPLLVVWRSATPARAALTGTLAGVACFGVVLSWTWYFGAIAIVPLVLIQSLYWGGAGALVGALGRLGVRHPAVPAAAWCLAEGARGAWPLGGLAWGEVGTALAPSPTARALAPWGGVLLVSFVVVLLDGIGIDLVVAIRRRAAERGSGALRRAVALLATTVVVVSAAIVARPTTREAGSMRIATIQGNDLDRRLTRAEIDRGLLTERHLRLARRLRGRLDLIVFPESALMSDPEVDLRLRERLVAIGRRHDADVLVNVIERRSDGTIRNLDRMYAPDGRLLGGYAKRHLVPFGEYVPWRSQLGFIRALEQVPEDFTPGDRPEVFRLPSGRVGTLICFESAFSALARDTVRAGAEVIVVSTNNRSYRRSGNSAQHLEASRMRAAETGRAVVQAAVSGISAVITPEGRIARRTRLFEPAVVVDRIPLRRGETPATRHGPWILLVSAVVLGSAGVVARRRRSIPDPPTDEGARA